MRGFATPGAALPRSVRPGAAPVVRLSVCPRALACVGAAPSPRPGRKRVCTHAPPPSSGLSPPPCACVPRCPCASRQRGPGVCPPASIAALSVRSSPWLHAQHPRSRQDRRPTPIWGQTGWAFWLQDTGEGGPGSALTREGMVISQALSCSTEHRGAATQPALGGRSKAGGAGEDPWCQEVAGGGGCASLG